MTSRAQILATARRLIDQDGWEKLTIRTPEQAVDVFRSIWYYTVGEILVRIHSASRRPAGNIDFTAFDPAKAPTLAAIGPRWPALAARDTYAPGLRAFVTGLLSVRTGR